MSKRLIQNLAKTISKNVDHFNKTEVECLIREFHSLLGQPNSAGKSDNLDERKFKDILKNDFGLINDTIMERVFRSFDKDNDGFVNVKEWVEGLCVFLRGSLDEKIKYCFRVYDLSGDEHISREEMLLMTRNCLRLHGEEDPFDGIKDLVEITLKRMNQALELSSTHGPPVFLSWTLNRSSSSSVDAHRVEICRHLGEKLGLRDGEEGFLRPCQQVSSVHQVFVEPLSSDDWEILELHSGALEEHLLDQIRVVFQHAVFPVWVDNHTVIFIQIVSLSPSVPFGRLEPFTELIVSPKNHTARPEGSSQPPHGVSDPPSQTVSTSVPQSQQWGLKSLFGYMTKGTRDPIKELPSVPDVPALLQDSRYRVCGAPPLSLGDASHIAPSVLHVLPWGHGSDASLTGGLPAVTFGLLSRVASPREAKERTKSAAEKQKEGAGEEVKEEATVVRLICHDVDELAEEQRRPSKGMIHCGKVWIPPPLTTRLNISPHSTVRIRPVKSTVKVASSIRLQPLNQLKQEDEVDEIQTAFLGWLHTQSHQPLACLTPRSGSVLLHGTDAKLEFAVTVLKPEPESDPADQLFLLAPSVLQKKHIQVVREAAITSPANDVPDPAKQELPSLETLGGVDEVSRRSFEFISHSLLASPLARELGVMAQGLRGGALLITGAKGSGKSALSRALCRRAADELDAHVEVLECKTLQGKRAETVRQTLQDVFRHAQWQQPSVVLLDDLDHVTPAPSTPEHDQGPEALLHLHIAQSLMDIVDQLVDDNSLTCLIVTSLSQQSLHNKLTCVEGTHFFQGFTHIQPPDQAQRADILRRLIQTRCPQSSVTFDLEAVAKKMEGYLPQDVAVLLERAVHANTARGGRHHAGVCLSLQDFEQALEGFTPPSLWGVDLHTPSGPGLDGVGGLTEVRQQLMDTIMLPAKYPVLFANLPIRHRSGILLYGAPGTGKTLLARAVAKDSGMNFIAIKGPELLSKYIGASEQGVRDVFQRAQAAKPCILFFDEFDSLAPRRGHDSTGVTDRVVNQLLTQLDGAEGLKGVYVLAATSRPDLIDPALLRPGRLDKSLYCPLPGREDRLAILKVLSAGVLMAPDVDLEELASRTGGFTGADLKALLYNAQLEALNGSLEADAATHEGLTCNMSLSSMTFPNHSSSSDDPVDEGHARASPEPSKEQQHGGNLWRLYFGSPLESECGNSAAADVCVSQSDSLSLNPSTRAPSLPPLTMSSLRSGLEELTDEHLQRLQEYISHIKSNYCKAKGERVWVQSASTQPGILLRPAHLHAALDVTRPSLSDDEWRRHAALYEAFRGSAAPTFRPGQRVTLA
ncbi:peroxisome biogenesis factor 1 isoform X1 [Entelurus aequoreus]|uniref:peroxisome biogenesis factor 1 isoform X1 n=2 Tax=Entelurus aequoreus TaxID=161455 RepID=UPI002B1DD7A9|nr:peroxisome biogenesis factor 1 isoform X1 [Entelurus aequoreus]XP_061903196.1 peroxisome biogenesis factor 1 isoform X1 [Entelurus aequoreus]